MNFETLALRQEGCVLKVTLSNAPINLINGQMVGELFQLAGRLNQDTETRVVVFDSADPDFFIAHFDLNDIVAAETDPSKKSKYPDINALQSLGLAWQNLPQVKIAKIDGRCRGGGLELILALDMRFASRRSVFCFPEASAGFLPGGGGATRSILMAGPGRALELILSSRDFTAEEMERYGLINRCLDDDQLDAYVDDLVSRLSLRSAEVVSMVREVSARVLAPMVEPIFAGLAAENEGIQRGMVSEEMQYMMQAHLETGQARELELDLPAAMTKMIAARKR